jgi:hypothetical protein
MIKYMVSPLLVGVGIPAKGSPQGLVSGCQNPVRCGIALFKEIAWQFLKKPAAAQTVAALGTHVLRVCCPGEPERTLVLTLCPHVIKVPAIPKLLKGFWC